MRTGLCGDENTRGRIQRQDHISLPAAVESNAIYYTLFGLHHLLKNEIVPGMRRYWTARYLTWLEWIKPQGCAPNLAMFAQLGWFACADWLFRQVILLSAKTRSASRCAATGSHKRCTSKSTSGLNTRSARQNSLVDKYVDIECR